MKRLLCGSSGRGGFTLVETLVVSAILAVILTALCGVYFAAAAEWERQRGTNDGIAAVTQACSKLSSYASQAVSVTAVDLHGTGDALGVCLPADSAYGVYVPTWTGGSVKCRDGAWMVFYLSDLTGSYSRPGNILWAASVAYDGHQWTIVPDSSWSLYPGGQVGRITPVTSLHFAVDANGSRPKLTMVVGSSYKTGTTSKKFELSRTVSVRTYD